MQTPTLVTFGGWQNLSAREKEEGKSFQFDVKRATQERPKRHFVLCLQTHSATSWRQARLRKVSPRRNGWVDRKVIETIIVAWTRYLLLLSSSIGETCWSTEIVTLQRPRRSHSLPRCCCDNNKFRWHEEYASLIRRFVIGPCKEEDAGGSESVAACEKFGKMFFGSRPNDTRLLLCESSGSTWMKYSRIFFEFAKNRKAHEFASWIILSASSIDRPSELFRDSSQCFRINEALVKVKHVRGKNG